MPDKFEFNIDIRSNAQGDGAKQTAADLAKVTTAATEATAATEKLTAAQEEQQSKIIDANAPVEGPMPVPTSTAQIDMRAANAERASAAEAIAAKEKETAAALSLQQQAVRDLAANKLAMLEATLAGQAQEAAFLEQNLTIEKLAVQLERQGAMERGAAYALAEKLVMTEAAITEQKVAQAEAAAAQAAAEAELAAGSALAGVNIGKARAEATTLARELATGNVNMRTFGALMGSLGPKLMGIGMAGFLAFEGFKKWQEEIEKGFEAQIDLTKKRADAEKEWQSIASNQDWVKDREKIETNINDLFLERSKKQGDERAAVQAQIDLQEGLLNRLDRVAGKLIEKKQAEKESYDLTEQQLELLKQMPDAYGENLKALKEQMELQAKLDEIGTKADLARIDRKERSGEISHADAEAERQRITTAAEERQFAEQQRMIESEKKASASSREETTKKRIEAEQLADSLKRAADEADKAALQNQRAIEAARAADESLQNAQKAPRYKAEEVRDPSTGEVINQAVENPDYQKNVDAAEAASQAAKSKIKDQASLQEDATRLNRDAAAALKDLEAAKKADQETSQKDIDRQAELNRKQKEAIAIQQAKKNAQQEENEDRSKQAGIKDQEKQLDDHVRALRNEIKDIGQNGKGLDKNGKPTGAPSNEQEHQIAQLQKRINGLELEKKALRSPISKADRDEVALNNKEIDKGDYKLGLQAQQEAESSAQDIFGMVQGSAMNSSRKLAQAASAVKGTQGKDTIQAMEKLNDQFEEFIKTVHPMGEDLKKVRAQQANNDKAIADLKRAFATGAR